MPKKERISRAALLAELEKKLACSDEPQLNKDMHRLSLRSAAFLLGDPAKPPEEDLLDREQAEALAGQIARRSDPNYMDWNYGDLREGEAEKHFEGMLLQTIDGLALPEGIDRAEKREALRARVEARGPTYAEYLLLNTARTPAPAEYREKDEPLPGGPVPDKTGKLFTAFTHCMCRNAGKPALRGPDFDREAGVYAGMPLCCLALRNRRTAEMLERREFGSVAVALKKTQDSFQFAGEGDFRAAQKDVRRLLNRMAATEVSGSGDRAWEELRRAAQGFTRARFRFNDVDAVIGAKLFLAAERFFRERKCAPGDPAAELALALVASAVPDAARNPDVKTLVAGLNDRRRPGEPPFTLPDNGALSLASASRMETAVRQPAVPVPAGEPISLS